jgi:hypothetical protein
LPRPFWHPAACWTGLAASLAAAFILGWTYHRGLEQTTPSTHVNQTGSVAVGPVEGPQEARGKLATERLNPTKPTEALASIDPIIKRLQQRGYSVETEKRLVSMESKDGRKIKLPVQEVRIRYVGDRIY